ncbi:LiaF transmembrane domain-containing protein [Sutcliffiella cohnii]
MKKNSFLSGFLLVGFGVYFLLQQLHIEIWDGFFTWTTFLLIIGLGIVIQAYKQSDAGNILPGIALLGVGVHFQVKNKFAFWPDDAAMIILIVAIGFFLRWLKTKQGLLESVVLLLISGFFLFSNSFLGMFEKGFSFLHTFWPIFFIIIGIYLLFFKRK